MPPVEMINIDMEEQTVVSAIYFTSATKRRSVHTIRSNRTQSNSATASLFAGSKQSDLVIPSDQD